MGCSDGYPIRPGLSKWIMAMAAVLVPLARLELALLSKLDFESSASTNSTTGAPEQKKPPLARCASGIKPADRSQPPLFHMKPRPRRTLAGASGGLGGVWEGSGAGWSRIWQQAAMP
jgi:hypothetical protein